MDNKLSSEDIIALQERLYELERHCSTGFLGTAEEQKQRILAFFAEVKARKKRDKSGSNAQ